MAGRASNGIKQSPAIVDGGRAHGLAIYTACRRGLIEEAHETHECHNVGGVAAVFKVGVIFSKKVGRTFRVFFSFIRENLIGDTHLDVVCLAGKDEKRLVLCFPSETSHCSVVTVPVHMPGYPEVALQSRGIGSQIVLDSCVRDAFNQAGTEHRRWDAEDHIGRIGEIRLADRTASRGVLTPGYCKLGDTRVTEKLELVMSQPRCKRLASPRRAAAYSRVCYPGGRDGAVLNSRHSDSRKTQRRRRNCRDHNFERYSHRDLSNP